MKDGDILDAIDLSQHPAHESRKEEPLSEEQQTRNNASSNALIQATGSVLAALIVAGEVKIHDIESAAKNVYKSLDKVWE